MNAPSKQVKYVDTVGYRTYFLRIKKSERRFCDASNDRFQARYQSYPDSFEFEPKSLDKEPNRIADFKIDLDKEGDIELTISEALRIIDYFKNKYGVSDDEWRLWFSGGKGCHMELKARVLGLETGRWNLPLIYKQLMKEIIDELHLKSVDLSIYNMKTGKPFRCENIKRENGNFKVPVTQEEFVYDNHDSFIQSPRELADTRPGNWNDQLASRTWEIEKEPEHNEFKNKGEHFDFEFEDAPPCIEKIMKNRKVTADKCDFNNSMMTLTRWFLSGGIDFDEAIADPLFEDFVLEFPSGSLGNSARARRENVKNRFSSMSSAGEEFACGYAKALGIKLDCDSCAIHLGVEDKNIEDPAEIAKRYLEKESRRAGDLDMSILPDALRFHIEEAMKRTDVHPLMLLNGALGAASAAIGKRADYPWFGGSRLYCNLYTLLIADSGAGKSTALTTSMRDIRRITADYQGYIGEEEQKEEPDQDIIKLNQKRLLTVPERTTLEALVGRLNIHDGVIATAEFGGFLKGVRSSGGVNGMMEVLSDIYDCPDHWQKETVTKGQLTLKNPYLSICGCSTLEFVQGELSKSDVGSGALARYLFFYPPSSDVIPPALPTNNVPMPEMTIYKQFMDIDGVTMMLSQDAEERHNEIFDQMYIDIRGYGEKATNFMEPFLKRWGANIIKIAMIFQQFEKVGSDTISLKTLEAAWHVVELAIESTKLLFDNKLGLSEHQEKCNRVVGYLARNTGKATRRQLSKNQVLKGGTKDLDYVLDSLSHSGIIKFSGVNLHKPKTEIFLAE